MKSELQKNLPRKFVPHNGITDEQMNDVVILMDRLISLQADPLYTSNNLANAISDLHYFIMELRTAQENQRLNRYHAVAHDGR